MRMLLKEKYYKFLMLFVVIGSLFFLSGCGSGGGSLTPDEKENPSLLVLTIDNNYQEVSPDGKTVVPITAKVYNGYGDPVSDVRVQISKDPDVGSFDSTVKTTHDGVAVFYYTVPTYDVAEDYNVSKVNFTAQVVEYSSVKGSSSIFFKVNLARLIAVIPDNSTVLPADNSISVPITVYAYGSDGRPYKNELIFAKANPNIGYFSPTTATTSNDGIARFTYTLPSKEDAEEVGTNKVDLIFTNSDGTVTGSNSIVFNNIVIGNGKPAAITLKAQPSTIFSSGVSSGPKISSIVAKVVDSTGSIVKSGYTVTFSLISAPNGTYITPLSVPVNNGYATTSLVAGSQSGTALIKAVVNYPGVSASSTLVYITTGSPSKITIVEGGKVHAQDDNGTRSINIYAFVKDSNGNPVADGTAVSFSVSDSCGGIIQPQSTTKDGIASANLVYPSQCIWKNFTITAGTSGAGIIGSLHSSYPAAAPVSLVLSGPATVSKNGGYIQVVATLKDEGGNGLPIEDEPVLFSSSLDNVTFSPKTAYTNNDGLATTTVYIPAMPDNATQNRTISIIGQSGSALGSLTVTQVAQ